VNLLELGILHSGERAVRVAYHGRMRAPSRAGHRVLLIAALALLCPPALAGNDAVAPVTSLSPDQRPTLVIVAAPAPLLIEHHPRPLSPTAAEAMAFKLGLFVAGPIIRRYAREGLDPLPQAWQSGQPDRGFSEALEAALDRTQANWPWRDLKIVSTEAKAREALADAAGEDVAIVRFKCELEDWIETVQYSAEARVSMLRDVGTARESRTEFDIRHLSRKIPANWGDPRRYATVFESGGTLDEAVNAAALDLSRALAVTISRLTTATPNIQIAGLEFGQLLRKPHCPVCRPSDTVLQQAPGRVWVAPWKLAGTILSLPVAEPRHARVASDRPAP
jgi:hypothetical protein